MFFQETTPDTSGYMIAGYTIAFVVMGLYVLSIYLRNRNLSQDLTMLEELDKTAAETEMRSADQRKKNLMKPGDKKQANL